MASIPYFLKIMVIIKEERREGTKEVKRRGRLEEKRKDSELETLGEVIVCILFK